MHWIKNFNFLNKNLLHLLHISSILKMCLSSSFIMSSSLAQLSATFSVLLAAITHFTLAFFSTTNIHNELLSPDNSGSGWENFLLAQN